MSTDIHAIGTIGFLCNNQIQPFNITAGNGAKVVSKYIHAGVNNAVGKELHDCLDQVIGVDACAVNLITLILSPCRNKQGRPTHGEVILPLLPTSKMECDGCILILKDNTFTVCINEHIMNSTRLPDIMLATSLTNGKLTARTWLPIEQRLEVKLAIVSW
eukprot:45178_1